MQQRFYREIVQKVKANPRLRQIVLLLCQIAPWAVVAAYGITFIILIATWNLKWIFFLIVPAVAVVIVTLLRNALNKPRPFERFNFEPLIGHGKGKSFPSRHTASAVVIAMACLYVNIVYGIFMLLLAAAIGVTRVMAGVHHILDVITGAAISVAIGLLGFVVFAPLFGL